MSSPATDPRDTPAHAIADAARILRVPASTLRSWLRAGVPTSRALITPASSTAPMLSFNNLVEAHVLAAFRRVHLVKLDRIRDALGYVRERLGDERPLISGRFLTDGADLFIEGYGELLNASRRGQPPLPQILAPHLARVEVDRSRLEVRCHPYTRHAAPDDPRVIVIDPRVSFGQPVITGTGVPTAVIASRFAGGESVMDLADDYGLDASQIDEAIRWEPRRAA